MPRRWAHTILIYQSRGMYSNINPMLSLQRKGVSRIVAVVAEPVRFLIDFRLIFDFFH